MPLARTQSDNYEGECPECVTRPDGNPKCPLCHGTFHVPNPQGERLLEFVFTWSALRHPRKAEEKANA